MADTEIIRIVSIIENNICVTAEDGNKVHSAILKAINEGKKVAISFKGVVDVTSLFLNTAVGKLYDTPPMTEDEIKEKISVIDATPQDLETLSRTVQRAKEYYKDPKPFHSASDEFLGDDDE